MTDVAELIVEAVHGQGVRTVWGVVGDALNPVTDAVRRHDEMEWVGVSSSRRTRAFAIAKSTEVLISRGTS